MSLKLRLQESVRTRNEVSHSQFGIPSPKKALTSDGETAHVGLIFLHRNKIIK